LDFKNDDNDDDGDDNSGNNNNDNNKTVPRSLKCSELSYVISVFPKDKNREVLDTKLKHL
jgi:hypothetical protein